MVQALPRLEQGKYTFLVAAPLNRADFEPQVIIVYGNPAQLSILIQSTVYATGEPVMSGNTGAFACGGEITMPILTDQCQLVMAGGGDRTVAQTQDHEAAFAIPAGKVEALVEGLEQIHKAGMRYPTPSFLTYQSVFPRDFGELMNYSSQ